MKKNSKVKNSSVKPKVDPYLEGLMAKLLEHLVNLEKKVDSLLALSANKTQIPQVTPPKLDHPQETKQPPRRDKVLYEAICADCHKVCEVPFRPSENRPVYCKECFGKRKSGQGPNKFQIPLTPVALNSKPQMKASLPSHSSLPAESSAKKNKKPNRLKKSSKR